MSDHAPTDEHDVDRPYVIDAEQCSMCNRGGLRVAEVDPGVQYEAPPVFLCADCLGLALDTIRETP